jgi:hypothetical protein
VLSEVEATPALRKSAAHEVNDFEAVAFGHVGLCPLCPGDDIAIQLYGYAVLFHAELFDQQSEGGGSEGLFLPIDYDFHCHDFRN